MAIINAGANPLGDQIRRSIRAPSQYGVRGYGAHSYGAGADICGIYQIRVRKGKQIIVKEKFYVPTNPQTEGQQAWRQIFADAIAGWQALTSEQKAVYNINAKYKPYSGYNLYLREYLQSH